MLKQDEMLFVVDEENHPREPLPRKIVHAQKIWHRTSHIWIINKKKEILCHQRSLLKDTSPGNWDPYCGGHLGPNISYEDGALKELQEELGIAAKKTDLQLDKVYKNKTNVEFQAAFIFVWDGDNATITIEKDEVEQVKWFSLEEVYRLIVKEKTKGWSKIEYANDILKKLLARFQ